MERASKTDESTYYLFEFAGGGMPQNLVLQNAHASETVYLKIGRSSTVPAAGDFDIYLPAAMTEPIVITDISVQVITASYSGDLAVWRYPRTP